MTSRNVFSAAAALLLAACGSNPSADVGDADGGASSGVDASADVGVADDASADDTSLEPDAGAPVLPELADCTALGLADVGTFRSLPEPPAEALGACALLRIEDVRNGGDRETVYAREGDTLRVDKSAGGNRFSTETWRLGPDDAVRAYTFEFYSGGVLAEERAWEMTPSGRLARYRFASDPALATEIVNTWDGERLVERRRTSPNDDETLTFFYSDAGVLERAEQQVGESLYVHTYGWNEDGSPASVTRERDGVVILTQAWTSTDAGHTYVATYDPSGTQSDAGFAQETRWPADALDPALDPRTPALEAGVTASHWAQSLPTEWLGCALPPRSLGHGYPSGEPWYDLGTPIAERPDGIGFVYGNDSFLDNYGDYGYYGHDGIHTEWPPQSGLFEVRWRFELTYDASWRMLDEVVTIAGVTPNASTPAETDYRRTRRFVGNRLESDAVRLGGFGGDALRELSYDHEATTSVRSLLHGDLVLAEQTTAFDDARRWTTHAVATHERTFGFWSPPSDVPEIISPTHRYERAFAADGQLERFTEANAITGEEIRVTTWERSADGREEVERLRSGSSVTAITRAYDDDGRLTYQGSDFGEDGSREWETAWRYSDDGRLLEVSEASTNTELEVVERRYWSCDE